MLYRIVRPLATVAVYTYFRKVYLSNADRIPRNKPVILACNHPTAFLEPCILACLLDRPLYFLVRGDFFVNPFYARLLRALHMLPVYRWKDGGYQKLKDNYSTFEACHRALRDGRTIMIFAEGNTKYEKRLRPLQKGLARIAFGALEDFPEMEDVYIVPVGVTYTQADRFRSQVMIDCGEPLPARDFLPVYRAGVSEGINALTRALEERMRNHLVHIEHPADDRLVEYLLEMDRADHPAALFPTVSPQRRPLERQRFVAAQVNALTEGEREILRRRAFAYFDRLGQVGVTDQVIAGVPPVPGAAVLGLMLGLPLALAGYLLNYLPLRAARWLADAKVAHLEFYAPVMVASGIGFYLLFFLLLLLIAGIAGGPAGLAGAFLVPALGVFTLIYGWIYDRRRIRAKRRALSGAILEELRKQREEVTRGVEVGVEPLPGPPLRGRPDQF